MDKINAMFEIKIFFLTKSPYKEYYDLSKKPYQFSDDKVKY